MGVAIFIVPEREPEGLDTFVDGKAAARVTEQGWDAVCAQAGVPTLFAYVSMNPEELEALMENGIEAPDGLPPEAWFEPADGLHWTRALAAHLRANPQAVQDPAGVLADLADYERIFEGLQAQGIRWHFQVDC
jgi:hypothetical protein